MTFNSDSFPILFCFIFIFGILRDLYLWNTAKGIIRKCLKEKGMMNIEISRDWFAWPGTLKFDVTYTTPNDVRHKNSCTLYYIRWLFPDEEIHWRDPL